ncbi:hypothetical protein LZD49_09230 [Dyadobacter sp. CY261]|uniref:hypothetical protein n=1 Tax=Dyadobacter sp. CY261 TaxID=2907203 RepID=UPI001F15F535|nr:hypothetical protein [Dyadobacter sp. CY261]MCF0070653.1 hypothetical protein [Dyadobacter sp. CY261]
MKLKVSLLIFLVAAALAACVDIPDFSDTPVIFYNGISQDTRIDTVQGTIQETEIVTVTINFEDGDGDLGASVAETQDTLNFTGKYLNVPNWNLEANYELVTMIQQKDSTWSESVLIGDRFKFFPILKTDGKAGPIKGKLDMNARFRKLGTAVPTKIKFKVRIIDRAFRISNQIETDPVTVRLWQ